MSLIAWCYIIPGDAISLLMCGYIVEVIYIYLIRCFGVKYRCIFLRVVLYIFTS